MRRKIGLVRELSYQLWSSGTRRVGSLEPGDNMQNYVVKSLKGEDVSLKQFLGKVVLVVNTASRWGSCFTNHFKT